MIKVFRKQLFILSFTEGKEAEARKKLKSMINKKLYLLLFFALMCNASVYAQDTLAPFWKEIKVFKQRDSLKFPAPNQILFIGSSSFTNWKDAQQSFPGKKILNRAFGGSMLVDLIFYRYEVIFPYQPKQIVIYCGENDFASSDTVSVDMVVQRFETLFNLIRAKYKTVPIAYVSMKPSPSRLHLLAKYVEGNKRIKNWLATKLKTVFVNVYDAMLTKDGKPMPDIFKEDNLHMNEKGYAIWKKRLLPVLLK
jgi:lysophospholipase L1-like esterase